MIFSHHCHIHILAFLLLLPIYIHCGNHAPGVHVRLSLKKSLFPVEQPGGYSCRLGTFFEFFDFFLFPKTFNFLPKKKECENKKILRQPDWPQFWPPTGQETNLFLRLALQRRDAAFPTFLSCSNF